MKKWKKWLAAGILAALTTIAPSSMVAANSQGYERWLTVVPQERQENQTFAAGRATEKVSEKAWEKIDGICYNGSGKEIPEAITRGIDVSEFQDTINWKKVKKSDVDYAFVRISYGANRLDKMYKRNMEKANEAGVPVGTYVYSLALTPEMALKEAKVAIEQMKGYKVSYPVVFDLEYSKMGELSKTQVSKIALAFCNEVKKAGYYPMVYCNTNWYRNHVNWSLLSGIDVWLAQYGDTIQAPSHSSYNYTIWQATDGDGGGTLNSTKKLIDGIPVWNNIDVDFGYVDYTKKITPRTQPLSSYTNPSDSSDSDDDSDAEEPSPEAKNGFIDEDGKSYYYINGEKAKGWRKIDGKYYYFNSQKGYLYKNTLLTSSKYNICYMDETGARVSDTWVTWKDKKYYIASNGYALKGVRKVGEYYYYFHSRYSYMLTDRKAVSHAGNIYYFNNDGIRVTRKLVTLKEDGTEHTYYFEKNGRARKGWRKMYGKWYFFHRTDGYMYKNCIIKSGSGKKYIFNADGVCVNR